MADADDVRRLALGLPHVQEIDSDGFDFRVAGKGFVWSYPERRPGKPRLIRTDSAAGRDHPTVVASHRSCPQRRPVIAAYESGVLVHGTHWSWQ
jgi:hypothetical protein